MPITIRNTTVWPDAGLRAMLRWVMRELEVKPDWIRAAWFRNRSRGACSGHAYLSGRQIVVSIGPASAHPWKDRRDRKNDPFVLADRLETLVYLTAHEAFHHRQWQTGMMRHPDGRPNRDVERAARFAGHRAVAAFRARRAELLAKWRLSDPAAADAATPKPTPEPEPVILAAPAPAPARPTRRERNRQRAERLLAVWERKLKLARTKVAKYRRATRRYEREDARAAERGPA